MGGPLNQLKANVTIILSFLILRWGMPFLVFISKQLSVSSYLLRYHHLIIIFLISFCYGVQTDALTVITENDWKCFCEEWGGMEGKGISAWVELSNFVGSNSDGLCDNVPRSEVQLGSVDEDNGENESRLPQIRTSPEVIRNFHLSLFALCSCTCKAL